MNLGLLHLIHFDIRLLSKNTSIKYTTSNLTSGCCWKFSGVDDGISILVIFMTTSLNSGIFRICNDTKLEPIYWELNIKDITFAWETNIQARTIFFHFQNAGRQGTTRETITGVHLLTEYSVKIHLFCLS